MWDGHNYAVNVVETLGLADQGGLVRAGLGATFMAPSEAKQLPDEVVFRSLDGPAPESRLVLGWRKDASPDPALGAFLVVAGAAVVPTGDGAIVDGIDRGARSEFDVGVIFIAIVKSN